MQNLSAPISRLPPEILSSIFLDVREASFHEAKSGPDHIVSTHHTAIPGWIALTHVCYAWRAMGLALPQLWSVIHLGPTNCKWVVEMLKRSKPSPVSISVDLSRIEKRRALALLSDDVKDEVFRLKDLRLQRLNNKDLQKFFSHQLSASQLESFRIACSPDRNERPFILSDQVIEAPSLTSLSIVRCQIDWNSRLFHRLTHLRLCSLPVHCCPIVHQLLSVLRKMPLLQSLYLRDPFEDTHPQDNLNVFKRQRVDLTHLKDIQLLFRADHMVDFLLNTNIPLLCLNRLLRVESIWEDRSEDYNLTYDQIVQFFSTFFSSTTSTKVPRVQSLRIAKSRGEQFGLQGFAEMLSHEQMDGHNYLPFLHLLFGWKGWDHSLRGFNLVDRLRPPLKAIPIQDLVMLQLSGSWRLDRDLWASAFGRIPSLRSILVATDSVGFLEALSLPLLPNQRRPLFPALKSIIIQDPDANMELVAQMLYQRALSGQPIESLSMPEAQALKLRVPGCPVLFKDYKFNVWRAIEAVKYDSDSEC